MDFGVKQYEYARRALRTPVNYLRELVGQITGDRVGGLSAEIAFFALLSFFPTVIVFAALLGSVDAIIGQRAAQDAEDWIVEQIGRVFGADNTLEGTVNDLFSGGSAGVLTIGAVIVVFAATRGFIAVVRALDIVYDHQQTRGWLSTRLVGLGITLMSVVVAAVVIVVLVLGPLLGSGERLSDTFGFGEQYVLVWNYLRWPLVFLVLMVWAITIYHVAPWHRAPWRIELPGALLATVWWSVVSLGFSTYLHFASSGANAVFGLLGGALSLLFWLYLMAMGLLVGAEVNALYARRLGVALEGPRPKRRLRKHPKRSPQTHKVRSTDDTTSGAS